GGRAAREAATRCAWRPPALADRRWHAPPVGAARPRAPSAAAPAARSARRRARPREGRPGPRTGARARPRRGVAPAPGRPGRARPAGGPDAWGQARRFADARLALEHEGRQAFAFSHARDEGP